MHTHMSKTEETPIWVNPHTMNLNGKSPKEQISIIERVIRTNVHGMFQSGHGLEDIKKQCKKAILSKIPPEELGQLMAHKEENRGVIESTTLSVLELLGSKI